MKKLVFFLTFNIFVSIFNIFSQTTGVGINNTGAPANSKALLDIDAKGMSPKAGLLLPRMNTADRNNIPTPIPESLLIYNTDTHCFEAYYNGIWVAWGCLSYCGNVTDYDGNVYNAVTIGTQCWMQQNLKSTKFNDGSAIPNVTDSATWVNLSTPGYCWYNNNYSTYGSIYGALYNWYTVNTGKLCPTGWHVPSDNEWTTLERAVCSSSTCSTDFPYGSTIIGPRGTDEGGKLKEAGTSHWMSPNTGATNSSGFSALPGGYRLGNDGEFNDLSALGWFWSSTEEDVTNAWYSDLVSWGADVGRSYYGKMYGFSVRCLKD